MAIVQLPLVKAWKADREPPGNVGVKPVGPPGTPNAPTAPAPSGLNVPVKPGATPVFKAAVAVELNAVLVKFAPGLLPPPIKFDKFNI